MHPYILLTKKVKLQDVTETNITDLNAPKQLTNTTNTKVYYVYYVCCMASNVAVSFLPLVPALIKNRMATQNFLVSSSNL